MSKTSLLKLAKKLKIPRRSCMKTKEEPEETIKDIIAMYKKTIFSSDTPACVLCLAKLRKQPAIDQHVYDQKLMEDTMRKLAWERLQRNIVMDGDTMTWVPKEFAIFCKKSSLPSFLPCSSYYSRCSFVISFTLALAWFLISALSLQYFSTSCSTL